MAYLDHAAPTPIGIRMPASILPLERRADGWDTIRSSPRTRMQRLPEHEVVFREGDPADRLYEVCDGAVMLYKLLADGRRQVVEVLGPGDLFGMSAGDAQDCDAETLVASGLRVIDRREAENSDAGRQHIARCLRDRLADLRDHAVLLGRKSAFERVATFLVRLVPSRGRNGCVGRTAGGDTATVRLSMTRQEIADYLGLTIETVSRVISDMRRRGVVVAERQDRLKIPDVCALCRLSGRH